jgi:group II intron reverse transcriptase/maturase
MHAAEQSDIGIVPKKGPNKTASHAVAEVLEERLVTKGNSGKSSATCTRRQEKALNGLDRIREAAARDRSLRFTNLMHHITTELLREAYYALRRDAAVGMDDVTWQEYGDGLEGRITDLHSRVQSGRFRAKPSKRAWLLKPDGRKRPIGIAALEDKIVQQAAVWVLNQIYEADFLGFSYGFRPERSQHNALDAIWVAIAERKVNYVLDADIRSFFDTINHEWLIKFLGIRIADPRMLRLIRKWLRAGVSEEGQWSKTEVGTPQGSVISPLLSNIYLHYVLDKWVTEWRKSKAQGEVIIVRYADDFVTGFQYQAEAKRFLQEMQERFALHGLEIHTEKTRLIEFGRFAETRRSERGKGKPETFDFLGFTHICGRNQKDNRFTIRRKTIAKRLRAKVKAVREEVVRRRHEPLPVLGKWLRSVVQGHLNYFAVPGNRQAINVFRTEIIKAWLHALRRRSQKAARFTWDRMKRLIKTWIPTANVKHPYPNQRLCVNYPR